MKKLALGACLPILLISACASQAKIVHDQLSASFHREQDAGTQFAARAKSECGTAGGSSISEVPQSKILEASKCAVELNNQIVMPVAVYPDLLARSNDSFLILADEYASGKISKTEFLARNQERFLDYAEACKSRENTAIQRAAQREQALADALESASNSMPHGPVWTPTYQNPAPASSPSIYQEPGTISMPDNYNHPPPAPMGVGQGARGWDGRTYIPAGADPNPSTNAAGQPLGW